MIGLLFASGASRSSSSPSSSHGNHATKWHLVTRLLGLPQIEGQPVSQFASFMLDRLFCFVEEISVHCLQKRMPQGVTITEIPLSEREAEKPERFQVTITPGGMPPWR